MAATTNLVRKNFVWRMEGISPTSTLERDSFRWVDGERLEPEQVANRSFTVRWGGSEEENLIRGNGFTYDPSYRVADHRFMLDIYYRGGGKLKDSTLHDLILQDRHDIIVELYNKNLVGYDADNTSDQLGLHDRIRESDEIVAEGAAWIYRSVWRCQIMEG